MTRDLSVTTAAEVARLALRPGDVVVITTREQLPPARAAALVGRVKAACPGHRVVLLEDAGIAVLAPDQVDADKLARVERGERLPPAEDDAPASGPVAGEEIATGQLLDLVDGFVRLRPRVADAKPWGTSACVIHKGERVRPPDRNGWVYAASSYSAPGVSRRSR